MSPAELERYLHEHIPLTRAMAVEVQHIARDEVTLAAPLEPNINHRETVFGGSAAALAILAAWALLHTRLVAAGTEARLVIQRNTMNYDLPITGRFRAIGTLAAAADWERFVRLLERRGRARIAARSALFCGEQRVAQFEGEFVAQTVERRNVRPPRGPL